MELESSAYAELFFVTGSPAPIHPCCIDLLNPALTREDRDQVSPPIEEVQSLEALSRCTVPERRTSYLEEIYDEPIQRSSRW